MKAAYSGENHGNTVPQEPLAGLQGKGGLRIPTKSPDYSDFNAPTVPISIRPPFRDIRFRGIAVQRWRASVFPARYPRECVVGA